MQFMSKERIITYREALDEALVQGMENDPEVFVMGCGVNDEGGIFGSTKETYQKFGKDRVMDVPLSENAIAGIGIGAAIMGKRPVIVHARNDFLLLAMDQIVNHAAKWEFMSGEKLHCPMLVRAIVGRGWGQAAQHSQSLQALFSHVPGLKVVLPACAHDAKGLLLGSLRESGPVISIEHRLLYETRSPVPETLYSLALGKGIVRRPGQNLTIVAFSYMVKESMEAAEKLHEQGIDVEVVDPRCSSPLDMKTILDSVRKTRKVIVADTGWTSFGISAEITTRIYDACLSMLEAPVQRVALPDINTPCSSNLEQEFYPGVDDLVRTGMQLMGQHAGQDITIRSQSTQHSNFQGPF
jgi:pyruvate dehydrogenase E1 component beta subunit|tara:strand:+ start:4384 stop:5445 length:1062 start_codon:yes stop_codon:yes gene_type:complete